MACPEGQVQDQAGNCVPIGTRTDNNLPLSFQGDKNIVDPADIESVAMESYKPSAKATVETIGTGNEGTEGEIPDPNKPITRKKLQPPY